MTFWAAVVAGGQVSGPLAARQKAALGISGALRGRTDFDLYVWGFLKERAGVSTGAAGLKLMAAREGALHGFSWRIDEGIAIDAVPRPVSWTQEMNVSHVLPATSHWHAILHYENTLGCAPFDQAVKFGIRHEISTTISVIPHYELHYSEGLISHRLYVALLYVKHTQR